ncbi:MAG: SGNH/GDSL hydrolase family protein [Bacteroidetes bacterium]|nr:SGNH/GDSL hydrolase family protein [Bacteroidota bacterium]
MPTDKKISELPVASSINATDLSVLVSSGTDYQFAFSTLLGFVGSGLDLGAHISFGGTLPQNTAGKDGDIFINTSAGNFAQKISGTWTVVYTLASSGGATDGTVLYGLGAPGSSTGNDNDTYINTGTGVFYKKSGGAWSQVFSMQTGPAGPAGANGTNGENGADGKSVLSGTADPSNLYTGIDGDFYINTTTYTLFGPKASGVWPAGTSLVGADGAAGPAGPKGDTGDIGPAGATGAVGPGVASGGTAGQILKKNSNTDYDTSWENPPSGGLSGLTPNEVLFGKSDGTLQQDVDLQFDPTTKSLYKNVTASAEPSGNKITILGDSISAGSAGVSNVSKRFGTVLAGLLGFTEDNHAVAGSAISGPGTSTGVGGYVMVNNLSLIPTYGTGYSYLIFAFGINDVDLHTTDPTDYNVTQFTTDYNTILTNAITTKGWPASKIILINTWLRNSPSTLTYQTSINSAIASVATSKGVNLLDIYTAMVIGGGLFLSEAATSPNQYTGTGTHPNDYGQRLTAIDLANMILSEVYKNNQAVAANGIVEFRNLICRNFNMLPDNDGNYVLAVDKNGNVGILPALPSGQKYNGVMNVMGQYIQDGSVVPTGAGTQDIIMNQSVRIVGAYDTAKYNSIEMSDGSNDVNLRNHYSGASWKFYNDSGSGAGSLLALQIHNGMLLVAGAGNVGGVQGDVWIGNSNVIGAQLSPHPSAYGKYVPMDYYTGHSFYYNTYSAGKHKFFSSGGIDGGTVESWDINSDGSFESVIAGQGIILKSPGGTRYRVTVSDAGSLVVAAA